jgi:hypothetical protein
MMTNQGFDQVHPLPYPEMGWRNPSSMPMPGQHSGMNQMSSPCQMSNRGIHGGPGFHMNTMDFNPGQNYQPQQYCIPQTNPGQTVVHPPPPEQDIPSGQSSSSLPSPAQPKNLGLNQPYTGGQSCNSCCDFNSNPPQQTTPFPSGTLAPNQFVEEEWNHSPDDDESEQQQAGAFGFGHNRY